MKQFFEEFEIIHGMAQRLGRTGGIPKYNFFGLEPGQCFVSGVENRPYLRGRASQLSQPMGRKFSVLTRGELVFVCRRS